MSATAMSVSKLGTAKGASVKKAPARKAPQKKRTPETTKESPQIEDSLSFASDTPTADEIRTRKAGETENSLTPNGDRESPATYEEQLAAGRKRAEAKLAARTRKGISLPPLPDLSAGFPVVPDERNRADHQIIRKAREIAEREFWAQTITDNARGDVPPEAEKAFCDNAEVLTELLNMEPVTWDGWCARQVAASLWCYTGMRPSGEAVDSLAEYASGRDVLRLLTTRTSAPAKTDIRDPDRKLFVESAGITARHIGALIDTLKRLHEHPLLSAERGRQAVFWLLDTIETETEEMAEDIRKFVESLNAVQGAP
ncbi:hypothetical protein GOB93_07610 [Acetobacter musti]|uniref:Uncharacterized protein n=1 Tax=Acetobacter musti TaxID=864732 RepID=A0ABX0JND3_9PROT|nr:hypothetical protein [Acetobacter musti]NHN84510.1 hypothetical protein [Acetobacter musti]